MDLNSKNFSFDNVVDFDDHINLSIPNYAALQEEILRLSSYFIKDGSVMYDLGCSTGKLLKTIASTYNYKDVQYIGIDRSDNLLKEETQLKSVLADLTSYDSFMSSDLVTSVFTLQFLPIKDRTRLLERVYKSLNPGGAFIISEKIYLPDGYLQDVFAFCYYDFKMKSFDANAIFDKQMSLRKIMRPVTEAENLAMFQKAGFKQVYPFWQSLLFKAWVCVK